VEGSCGHGNDPSGSIKCLGNSCMSERLAACQERMQLAYTNIYVYICVLVMQAIYEYFKYYGVTV
jgi:hypothetical protein